MNNLYGYIYLIANKQNGHTYVGKRCLYKKSWDKDGYLGSGTAIRHAVNKYGKDSFEKFLICYTESEKDACEKEKFWITEYRKRGKAEYNIADGGQGGSTYRKGRTYEDIFGEKALELKNKLSKSHKGQIPGNKGKKMGPSWNKGLETPEEVREKQSQAKKERPVRYWKGKSFSEEHRQKLSEARKGKSPANKGVFGKHWYTNGTIDRQYFPDEVPEGWILGRSKTKGRVQSKEERAKRSLAYNRSKHPEHFNLTDEQKQKLSWAKKEYYGSLK